MRLIKIIKDGIHANLNKFGFDLNKLSENYLNEKWSSPIELIYKTYKEYILIKVPMQDVRYLVFHGHQAGYDSQSPFILTIKEYINGQAKNYKDSSLYEFYSNFKPATMVEYLSLGNLENTMLNDLPASAAFFPWQDRDPVKRVAERAKEVEKDNKEHKSKLNKKDGDSFYGPVSLEKGELEYTRLIKTYNSIATHGFKVDLKGKNNIGAIILESNNEYRYLINPGQHRVAALSALNYQELTLQVNKNLIVRRSEVCYWPGVINGYFTESEALKYFDRVFEGKVPDYM